MKNTEPGSTSIAATNAKIPNAGHARKKACTDGGESGRQGSEKKSVKKKSEQWYTDRDGIRMRHVQVGRGAA